MIIMVGILFVLICCVSFPWDEMIDWEDIDKDLDHLDTSFEEVYGDKSS